MEYIYQLSRRKNLSIVQKYALGIAFIMELPVFLFSKVCNYFGIYHKQDKIMFFGFYGFCSVITIFSWAIAHLN